MPHRNILSRLLDWLNQSVLGRKPEQPPSVREIVDQTLQPSDLRHNALGMINKMQRLRSPERWLIATWKATPTSVDYRHYYYLFCFETPYKGDQAESITLSTGVRQFSLKRSQGANWGQHQIQVFSVLKATGKWKVLYSRNVLFVGNNVMLDPKINAAATMLNLARQLLDVPLRNLEWKDWEFHLGLAIRGWGLVEEGRPPTNDYQTLDKK